jgi:hypothetical protein
VIEPSSHKKTKTIQRIEDTMNRYTKPLLPLLLALCVHGAVKSEVIAVVTESSASGSYLNLQSESEDESSIETVSFRGPQISENFGNLSIGSAGSFDSISDVDNGDILFKNGNSTFGNLGDSFSRTVVDITFTNTDTVAVRPILQSQILPAGMGFFVTDCEANDLRECESGTEEEWRLTNIFSPSEGTVMSTSFDFKVMLGDIELYSLSAGMSLISGEGNQVVQDFSQVEDFLTDFRQTSESDSLDQISFDWGATDFEVIFPDELFPNQSATLSYIIEVSTSTDTFCGITFEGGPNACSIAYGAFGDPIGRGGVTRPQGGSINGYEAGLFRFAAPTFENGVLSYRAASGPGIVPTTSVPAPVPISLLLFGLVCLILSRRRTLK